MMRVALYIKTCTYAFIPSVIVFIQKQRRKQYTENVSHLKQPKVKIAY